MPQLPMNGGRIWTREEIQSDCELSEDHFRNRRVNEPLDHYRAEYVAAKAAADAIIDQLDEVLANPANPDLLADIIANPAHFTAFRYLSAPPISADDLKTLLKRSVSSSAIRADPGFAESLVEVLRNSIDPERFPWIENSTRPTAQELHAAKVSTAVASTIQRVQTKRRGDEKLGLESAVEQLLSALGYTKVTTPRASIDGVEGLPGPGEYMTEVTIANHNGDFVLGLHDRARRRLALECKSSNSAINSRKRLNKEVVGDAAEWNRQFGNQVVTGAVLRGVFDPRYVSEAQGTPMLIFWSHRLKDLKRFIEATRTL